MIEKRYSGFLLTGTLFWLLIYIGITFIVNPYGVSPISLSIERVNKYKPKRLDIDRLIKPYEVWRYQPKTIFLGSSRIHQSIDPSELDGTRYAPAYNASIPASSLGLNISHLEQYISLDPNLRIVFVELFYWNFIGQGVEHAPKSFKEYLINTLNLFVSSDTLWDAILTFNHNFSINKPVYEIKTGGYFYYPPSHNAKGPFDGFPKGIMDLHAMRDGVTKLHMPAVEVLDEFVKLCKKNNIELYFILTPNHAYSDFYNDAIDSWDVVRQWLSELSSIDAVIYNFSQANELSYEEVSPSMEYWNDPFHFNLEMGRMMLNSIVGVPDSKTPDNFFKLLATEDVETYIRNQQEAIAIWAKSHTEFIEKFNIEKQKWESKLIELE